MGYMVPEAQTPKLDTTKNITEAPKAEATRLVTRTFLSANIPSTAMRAKAP